MNTILFISSSLSYGGAEKMLCLLANELAARHNRIIVLNLMEHRENAGRLNENVDVINIEPIKIKYLDRIDQLLRIIKNVKKIKPDIVISFKFRPNYLAVIAGKVLNCPVIISERCDPSKEYELRGRVKLYWRIINQADGGVFQLKGALQYYSEGMQNRGIVIPNPIEKSDTKTHVVRKNENSRIIVSVGRLVNQQKRYDIMLKAFQIFHNHNPNYILKIYGDGEDEDYIREWIKNFGLENEVFIEGKTSDPIGAMDGADVFLTTSDYEGISNSLLEAMSKGMPIVATDCTPGGARMLIEDGKNGLLVPCGNVDLIAAALGKMAENYTLRRDCGKRAKDVTKIYSKDRIMNMWIHYITIVIKRHSRRKKYNNKRDKD